MKFPLLANAFGQQKIILEIGGNAVGLSESRHQPQQHRRRHPERTDDLPRDAHASKPQFGQPPQFSALV